VEVLRQEAPEGSSCCCSVGFRPTLIAEHQIRDFGVVSQPLLPLVVAPARTASVYAGVSDCGSRGVSFLLLVGEIGLAWEHKTSCINAKTKAESIVFRLAELTYARDL